ncbi:hypothetical protein [Parvularcula sp. LCG005]|uniref:hypothetical protein n=1 Tax=Parvularcula sp. LCG005 TaxID=3078805 RepID=UPI0029432757|nr:hypothetical protein [Parvularcula sp. LCG005]WOI53028.1 hypothetical protein RUI03_12815 [Parvularcula sp. LCG005]WOI53042.1 hypothetical protein RUI03_12890 [Parvularcula sp. LCG005]
MSGTGKKKMGCLPVILIGTVSLFGVLLVISAIDESRLSALKEASVDDYLAKLKSRGDDRYWEELQLIYPEKYDIEWAEELERRKAEELALAQERDRRNKELAWEGELYSSDVPDGIYCSEVFNGKRGLEPYHSAYVAATEYIEDGLNVYGSGNFPVSDFVVGYINPCEYRIYSWYEGKNYFGVTLRSYYVAWIRLSDDGRSRYFVEFFKEDVRSPLLRN